MKRPLVCETFFSPFSYFVFIFRTVGCLYMCSWHNASAFAANFIVNRFLKCDHKVKVFLMFSCDQEFNKPLCQTPQLPLGTCIFKHLQSITKHIFQNVAFRSKSFYRYCVINYSTEEKCFRTSDMVKRGALGTSEGNVFILSTKNGSLLIYLFFYALFCCKKYILFALEL